MASGSAAGGPGPTVTPSAGTAPADSDALAGLSPEARGLLALDVDGLARWLAVSSAPAGQNVEGTLRAAVAALEEGDVEASVALTRRACKLAQRGGVAAAEYLAHLVLARLRRRQGRPHFGQHILAALARVAPAPFHVWIAWEAALCGNNELARTLLDGTAGNAARAVVPGALVDLIEAARTGVRARFDEAAAGLTPGPLHWRDLERDVAAVRALLDPSAAHASAEIEPWITGGAAEVPMGLGGLGAVGREGGRTDDVVALVLARPDARGRRLLRTGAPLSGVDELPAEASGDAQGFRTDRALAVLALCPGGALPIEEFFQAAYGFAFAPLRHQQVLHSLVWRMRQRLGDAGEVLRSRDERSLSLRLSRPVLIPDARCVLAVSDRVIRALGALGAASTEEAAAALRLPLRTIQRVIRDLVAEGDCRAERRGRGVVYRVQDTTFTATLQAPRV